MDRMESGQRTLASAYCTIILTSFGLANPSRHLRTRCSLDISRRPRRAQVFNQVSTLGSLQLNDSPRSRKGVVGRLAYFRRKYVAVRRDHAKGRIAESSIAFFLSSRGRQTAWSVRACRNRLEAYSGRAGTPVPPRLLPLVDRNKFFAHRIAGIFAQRTIQPIVGQLLQHVCCPAGGP
jgi:hypothetical protein